MNDVTTNIDRPGAPVSVAHLGYVITTDKSMLQMEAVHKWLSEESYWAKQIPFTVVQGAFDNSFCIGILKDGEQVGFARLVTDYYTFAYLADVYVIAQHRNKGLALKMMEVLFGLDWVQQLRRLMLSTLDMQPLYRKLGFTALHSPKRVMEVARHTIYGDEANPC